MHERITLYDFIEILYKEIKKNNLDTTQIKVMSVGNCISKDTWYYTLNVTANEEDYTGTDLCLCIPMYKKDNKEEK